MAISVPVSASWESAAGVPLVAPVTVPTIRIRRNDTQALVVTDVAMTEIGDGNFVYDFNPPVDGIEYSARADGDPLTAGQVPTNQRFVYGPVDNRLEEIWTRWDLNPFEQQTYENDGSIILNGQITLTKTDNGNCTFDIVRS